MTDYKFEGWLGLDKSAAEGQMVWKEFTPKAWEETDIDIKITHSGICGSDLHTLRSGWVHHFPSPPPFSTTLP
jgi:D-arabinose 1-dehydrogenase-like Zn-dependent alcohol dehydrogenase